MARSFQPAKWLPLLLQVIAMFIMATAEERETPQTQALASYRWRNFLERETAEPGRRMVAAAAVCFLAAAVSSAGGVGGGSLFLPILNLVAGVDLKTASKFSAFMVAGTATSNVIYSVFSDGGAAAGRHIIDYDIALLSEPCMLLGVTVGVICNVAFPEWLVTLLFAVVLSLSTVKTCKAGVGKWKEESEGMREKKGERKGNIRERMEDLEKPLLEEERESVNKTKLKKVGVLVLVWFCFFLLQLLRQGNGSKNMMNIEKCGVGYWMVTLSQVPVALLFTTYMLYANDQEKRRGYSQRDDFKKVIDNLPKIIFPVAALMAGVLGGLFGIGGGLLMNPVLLQIGVPPQTTAATSSFMVLFSASMSSVQYLMMGMKEIREALIMAAGCGLSSMGGVILVEKAVGKYGRASLVIFSLGTVMVLSSVSITGFGIVDIWEDYVGGRNLGFNLPC